MGDKLRVYLTPNGTSTDRGRLSVVAQGDGIQGAQVDSYAASHVCRSSKHRMPASSDCDFCRPAGILPIPEACSDQLHQTGHFIRISWRENALWPQLLLLAGVVR